MPEMTERPVILLIRPFGRQHPKMPLRHGHLTDARIWLSACTSEVKFHIQ